MFVPCERIEIWVREGEKEVAFTMRCLDCGLIGGDHPTLKELGEHQPRDPREIFAGHLRSLKKATLDFIDHCEGRPTWRRGYKPAHHPEGVPWSDRDPGRKKAADP